MDRQRTISMVRERIGERSRLETRVTEKIKKRLHNELGGRKRVKTRREKRGQQ